jgi:UDP-N-acetylmuramoylalanine--D-glutamate ligase
MLSTLREEVHQLATEPVAVLGLGVEGRATVDYLLSQGVSDITGLDQKPVENPNPSIKTSFGDNYSRDLWRFATVFRSPGIRPDHPDLVEARARSTIVTSAMDFFLRLCRAPIVGVTGTVGKGTATSLIAAMLEKEGFVVHLGGNIGKSPLEFLDKVNRDHRVVLEISSFQAMDLTCSPHVAVILKTTCEHLDWHVDVEEYRAAKARLVAHQNECDLVVYNADSQGSTQIAGTSNACGIGFSITKELTEGLCLLDSRFVLRINGEEQILPIDLDKIRLPGRFNLENVAAAILASTAAGASNGAAVQVAETFKGLAHRLEFVTQAKNVRFYNDSYATRPEATMGALSSFGDEPLALILGGSEKYVDFTDLARAISNHSNIVHIGLIGDTAKRLDRAIRDAGPCRFSLTTYTNLEPAMEGALRSLPSGGVVLLSPACASFGLFQNYKDRGERFRAKALELAY